MTNEEAIYELETNVDYKTPAIKEACQTAIKALEQQPCEDWYDVPSNEMTLEQARQAVKDLRKKLAEYLEQKPCEDVVSRDCDKCAYYDDGANDEACDGCFADEYEHPNFKPKAQHCDDCISRQAVDELSKELVHTTRDKADFLCNFWEGLQKLPPVTPKEKTAHWINKTLIYKGETEGERDCYAGTCSACGGVQECWKYCGGCGARMVSE